MRHPDDPWLDESSGRGTPFAEDPWAIVLAVAGFAVAVVVAFLAWRVMAMSMELPAVLDRGAEAVGDYLDRVEQGEKGAQAVMPLFALLSIFGIFFWLAIGFVAWFLFGLAVVMFVFAGLSAASGVAAIRLDRRTSSTCAIVVAAPISLFGGLAVLKAVTIGSFLLYALLTAYLPLAITARVLSPSRVDA